MKKVYNFSKVCLFLTFLLFINKSVEAQIISSCPSGFPDKIFTEDWESGQGNWTGYIGVSQGQWQINNGSTSSSNTGPSGAHDGNHYIFYEASGSGSPGMAIMVSPAIDLTQANDSAKLSFWMHAYGSDIPGATLSISAGTSPNGPFTTVYSKTFNSQLQSGMSDPYVQETADLTSFIGQTVYLEFSYNNPNGYASDLALDLLEIETCVSCGVPTNLTFIGSTGNEAFLSWNDPGSGTNWEVEHGLKGFTPGTGIRNTASSPHTVTGLNPLTEYDFYIRSICGPGDTSSWAGPLTGSTIFECPSNGYCFNNAGATGINGPTQSQLNSEYAGSNLYGQVNSINGIQEWIVPQTGFYRIITAGAKGGDSDGSITGGSGAVIGGEFLLNQGDTLYTLVGQKGVPSGSDAGGGGGGTFVTKSDPSGFQTNWGPKVTPLVIAGGGGGAGADNISDANGVDAITPEDAVNAYGLASGEGTPDAQGYKEYDGNEGTPGYGAVTGASSNAGGGGGGFLSSGSTSGGNGIPGDGFLQGGTGADGPGPDAGGFGGGASTPISNSHCSAGGGGGYSGGAGGNRYYNPTDRIGGGGGGSYNAGQNQSNQSGSNDGHGLAAIIPVSTGYSDDAGVATIDEPTNYCPGTEDIVVTIVNFGDNQIDTVDIEWSVNGVSQTPFTYTGTLDSPGGTGATTAQVTIGSYTFTNAPYDIMAWTSNPNNATDPDNTNDTAYTTVQSSISAPTNLSLVDTTGNTATFSWDGHSSTNSWIYVVVPQGDAPETGTIHNASSESDTALGLLPLTSYDFYVAELCPGASDTSAWAGPLSFSTTSACLGDINCFTHAGASGATGPTQSQLNTAYAGSTLDGAVTSQNGIQEWIVPYTADFKISTWGAEGGYSSGNVAPAGLGAFMEGEFSLNAGDTLHILVGQAGQGVSSGGGTGGGGTFVVAPGNNPLIVAAGGSGAPNSTNYGQLDGKTSHRGPYGGQGHTFNSDGGGGGGGFSTDGQSYNSSMNGKAYVNGGEGGTGGGGEGGFGGGGGKGGSFNDGAGGGGYSGGDHTYSANVYGGGGSYNQGSNTSFQEGVQQGHGMVTIEPVTTPSGNQNDAGVLSINQPSVFCPGDEDVVVSIQNFGDNQINNVDIHWSVNGVTQGPVSYTGTLDTTGGIGGSIADVNLGSYTFTNASYDIVVWTSNPNGVSDPVNSNDTSYATIQSNIPKPTNLSISTFDANSVSFSWNGYDPANNSWAYVVVPQGNTPQSGSPVSVNNENAAEGGLTHFTEYDIYVAEVCPGGTDTSGWAGPESFKTNFALSCNTGTINSPFTENWDGGQGNWSGDIGSSNSQWQIESGTTSSSNTGPNAPHNGSQYIYYEASGAGSPGSATMVSPAIDLSTANQEAFLSFWMHAYGDDIPGATLTIRAGTSPTGSFTTEYSRTFTSQLQSAESDPYEQDYVDLSAYMGQTIYLEIEYNNPNSFNSDLALDLLEIQTCLTCPAPSNLTASNLTGNSVDLSWTDPGSATNWAIEYGLSGFTPGTGTTVTSGSSSHTVTGLSVLTNYDFYVRSICGAGDTSIYTGPVTESTPFDCPATAFCFTNASATGATGPSQSQINSEYSGTNLDGAVTATNGIQAWDAPQAGDYKITAFGAEGGGINASNRGQGGRAEGTVSLDKGDNLYIAVGQAGEFGHGKSSAPQGGFNGGGDAGSSQLNNYHGSSGGGASDVRIGDTSLTSRLIVAGGGGGGTGDSVNTWRGGGGGGGGGGYYGGGGGHGGNEAPYQPGQGGTQSSGGTGGGTASGTTDGGLGYGGDGGHSTYTSSFSSTTNQYGGDGGGLTGQDGNDGGSSSRADGGGGGSSFTGGLPAYALTATNTQTGIKAGHGMVIIESTSPLTVNATASTNTVCEGDSTTLAAQANGGMGPYSYSWTSTPAGFNSTQQNPDAAVSTTTTFIVTVDDGFDTAMDSVTISTWPVPQASFTGLNSTYCENDAPTTLTGNPSGGTFSGNGINGNTFDPAIAGSGTHTITYSYTNMHGCSDQATQSVEVYSTPAVSFSGLSSTYCEDDSPVTLTGTPSGGNFSGNGISGNNFDPGAAGAGTHTITYNYTDSHGCSGSDSTTTNVIGSPDISASASPSSVNAGNSSTLDVNVTGTSTYTYQWSPADSLANPANANQKSPDTKPLVNPTYFNVVVTDNTSSCSATDTVFVNVIGSLLDVNPIASSYTVCPGSTTTLSAQAGGGTGSYSYSWSSSPSGFTSTQANPIATVTEKTTFIVMVDDGNNTVTDSVTVDVYPEPQPAFSGLSAVYCEDDSPASLSGNPSGGNFSGPGISGNSFDPVAAGVGTHSITYSYTDSNGCSNDTTRTTEVKSLPSVSFSGLQTSYCEDDAPDSLTGTPSGGTFYGNGISGNMFDPYVAGTGTHLIAYEYTDAHGCSNTDSTSTTVNVLPDVTASASPNPVSSGNATTLNASVSGTSTYSYSWSPADSLDNPANANQQSPSTKPLTIPTTFTVTATNNSSGCVNTDNIFVGISGGALTVNPVAADDTVCSGDSTTLAAQASGGTGNYTYNWSSNPAGFNSTQADPVAMVSTPTTFIITVDDGNTTATDSVTVGTWPVPQTDFTGLANSYCENDGPVTLNGTPAGGNFSGNGISGNTFDPGDAGTGTHPITYAYTNMHGCSHDTTKTTEVFTVPNVSFSGLQSTYCENDAPEVLTGTPAGGTFSGPGITGSTFDPATAGAGTHYIKYSYTNANGCTGIDSISTTVKPLPDITASASPNPVDYGNPTTLNANVSGSSSYSYAWSPADSLDNPANATQQNPATKPMTIATTFTVTVTDNSAGCSNTEDVFVSVIGGPLSANPVAADDILCRGDSTTLSAQASGGSGSYTYSWSSNPAGFSSTQADPAVIVNEPTTFIVTVDDGNDTATDSVTVNTSMPDIDLGADTTIQAGDSLVLAVDTGYTAYLWSNGNTTHSTTIDSLNYSTGTHNIWVTVTDSLGCTASDSISVTITTGIHDISDKGNIHIYPNPNKGIFNLEIQGIPDRKLELCVYNLKGQKIICEEITRDPDSKYFKTYDLSAQPKGVYLIRVTGNTTQKVKRIIIQ